MCSLSSQTATHARRARYLTKAKLEFSPFHSGSALGFLTQLNSKGVREAVPKLEVTVKRLRGSSGDEAARNPQMSVTFVDGREVLLDLTEYKVKDLYAEIEVQTGRLELEAMRRGKPWI